MEQHGTPCWFELTTREPHSATAFYRRLFGWQIGESGMEGYLLARSGDDMVAGLMIPDAGQDAPPNWLIYIAVDDADAAVEKTLAAGGQVYMGPADIPGTGRFAVLADPQGAVFGVLRPEPMDIPPPAGAGAWNQQKVGRGNWLELMSSDPAAGLAFYSDLFGWQPTEAMDMGEMGTYQMFGHDGATIGGMMGLGDAPMPFWLPYFGVDDVAATIAAITDGGGRLHHGPQEVPGPALIAIAQDPQGAWFAIVGPKP